MFESVATTDHDAYLAGLNRSFANWGSRDRLAWALRPFDWQAPDMFAVRQDGDLVAGSIVSYRFIDTGTQVDLVGIMTGSWTDPDLRGRGIFSAMIEHSAALAREQGAVALLAFVTADNASRRRLEAAGSLMVPTWYLSVSARDEDTWAVVVDVDDALGRLDDSRSANPDDVVRFVYPSVDDLRCQLLGRSRDARVVESASGAVAAVERVGDTLRVLATTDSTARPSLVGTQHRFSFTARAEDVDLARRSGTARVTDGFLTVLPLAGTWQGPSKWFLESGDRI